MGFHEASFGVGGGGGEEEGRRGTGKGEEKAQGKFYKKGPKKHDSKDRVDCCMINSRIDIVQGRWKCLSVC